MIGDSGKGSRQPDFQHILDSIKVGDMVLITNTTGTDVYDSLCIHIPDPRRLGLGYIEEYQRATRATNSLFFYSLKAKASGWIPFDYSSIAWEVVA
jgi:hypothetical protein